MKSEQSEADNLILQLRDNHGIIEKPFVLCRLRKRHKGVRQSRQRKLLLSRGVVDRL